MNAVDFPKFFNKCERKPKGQSSMDNQRTQATYWAHKTKTNKNNNTDLKG
jgi:hypothetical protein